MLSAYNLPKNVSNYSDHNLSSYLVIQLEFVLILIRYGFAWVHHVNHDLIIYLWHLIPMVVKRKNAVVANIAFFVHHAMFIPL